MKKLLSLLLALTLAAGCLPVYASAKGESLYLGVLQQLIEEQSYEVEGGYRDFGMFCDVNGDGVQELLVTRLRAAQLAPVQSASVYGIVNGRAKCLLQDQELFLDVGAPDGSIQAVEKDGKPYIAVYYRTGGGGGRYEHQGGWDLYSLDSAAGKLVKAHTVTFDLWYYEGVVLEDECSAVLDGKRLNYAQYDAWVKSLKVKAKAPGEGSSTFPQLLKQAQRGDTAGGFRDVYESDYFAPAVVWAVEKGITGGTGPNTFSPGKTCTRAQIMTFLWASKGRPSPSGLAGFSDMTSNSTFNKAISWAVENKISSGLGNNRFGPDRPCTRGQAVTFLWIAAGRPKPRSAASFRDMPGNPVFRDAISWAVENKITGGMGNGLFGTDKPCTRGQIAMFLYAARNK